MFRPGCSPQMESAGQKIIPEHRFASSSTAFNYLPAATAAYGTRGRFLITSCLKTRLESARASTKWLLSRVRTRGLTADHDLLLRDRASHVEAAVQWPREVLQHKIQEARHLTLLLVLRRLLLRLMQTCRRAKAFSMLMYRPFVPPQARLPLLLLQRSLPAKALATWMVMSTSPMVITSKTSKSTTCAIATH